LNPSILILGAGVTGLGAAWRLHELGYRDWLVLEAGGHPGGLAASYVDARGFTWDVGGHVLFSHYPYFDAVMDALLGEEGWAPRRRESWIWMRERFIPYPLQHNLRHLPKEDLLECLAGLVRARLAPGAPPEDFRQWMLARFGEGIARVFLLPYNRKVWAHPPEELSCSWTGDRVAEVDLERVLRHVILERDDPGWGPNQTFRYPLRGGTGAIWTACAGRLPAPAIEFGREVVTVDSEARRVRTRCGREYEYGYLISTLPLPVLCEAAGIENLRALAVRSLPCVATHVVGVGLEGAPPAALAARNWIYFPEDNCPFYRVTVFSNYSPYLVPDASRYWSLLCEVSESPHRPVDPSRVVEDTVAGLRATRLIDDAGPVVSTWHYRAGFGYPVPGCERDAALDRILPALEARGIWSRGRFGAWKYEVSNQDHSFMQGVEAVNRILLGTPEVTIASPDRVNAPAQRDSSSRS
jgi:protoporphyrinogen oxidase